MIPRVLSQVNVLAHRDDSQGQIGIVWGPIVLKSHIRDVIGYV
jgi:hypothetical protein